MIMDTLTSEMFLDLDNRKILQIALDLESEGVHINFTTVSGRIDKLNNGQDPIAYCSACVTAHNKASEKDFRLSDYIGEVRRKYGERRFSEMLQSSSEDQKKGRPLATLVSSCESDIQEISTFVVNRDDIGLESAADKNIDAIQNAYKEGLSPGVPWGFEALRHVASGNMDYGNFYGIMLDTGGGKSSLALQIARAVAEENHPVMVLSYEMTVDQCMLRMTSQRLGIEVADIRGGNISSDQFDQVYQDQKVDLQRLPIDIVKANAWGAKKIGSALRSFRSRRGKGLVIIDHAKSIALGKEIGLSEQYKVMMNGIRDDVAMTEHACIVLLQRRQESYESRDDPTPMKGDVYGRDALHEPLDLMIGMWRPSQIYHQKLPKASTFGRGDTMTQKEKWEHEIIKWENIARLHALKNRYGSETAVSQLAWEAKYTRFSDTRGAKEAAEAKEFSFNF